jgi:CheY-like chemotaxis protein
MALSVLIVDDDEPFLGLAKRVLADCGYRPEWEARNVADALQQATRHRPDLVIVDIGLPDGNGLDLSKQMTGMPWRVRVVLVSADSDATSQRGAHDAGALAFVPKSDLSCSVLHSLLRDG